MGRRGYPPEFCRRVLDLLAAGRRVADLARDLGVSSSSGRRLSRTSRPAWPNSTAFHG